MKVLHSVLISTLLIIPSLSLAETVKGEGTALSGARFTPHCVTTDKASLAKALQAKFISDISAADIGATKIKIKVKVKPKKSEPSSVTNSDLFPDTKFGDLKIVCVAAPCLPIYGLLNTESSMKSVSCSKTFEIEAKYKFLLPAAKSADSATTPALELKEGGFFGSISVPGVIAPSNSRK